MINLEEGGEEANMTVETHKKADAPSRRRFLKTAAALGTVGALATLPFQAKAVSADEGTSGIAATWEEVVTPTNSPVPPFHVLVTYDVGGGLIADTSGGSVRTIHGVWNLSDDGELKHLNKGFLIDPQGKPSGYVIVRDDLKLDEGGNTYSGTSQANFYDNNGVLVRSGNFNVQGTRITL
jgi:hypothetical protein